MALVAASVLAALRPGEAQAAEAPGYRLVAADGGVFAFGSARFHGSTGGRRLNHPVVGMETTSAGSGYWLVASDGGVFAFGDARFTGSTGAMRLNRPVVGMAATPTGAGYWLVASDGGVFAFGDARFHGSTGAIQLNRPIVGMAATPTGAGYWLVASDGGVFGFGDARFHGSVADRPLARPIVGIARARGGGYWMVASDGGVFAFGAARFHGSAAHGGLNAAIAGMTPTASGEGYWLAAADGEVFGFGDASVVGRGGPARPNHPIVGVDAGPVMPGEPILPGRYVERPDDTVSVTYRGGPVSTSVVHRDCFCGQRLHFVVAWRPQPDGSAMLEARLTNTTAVSLRLPEGLTFRVAKDDQPWRTIAVAPSLATPLDPGATVTLPVPIHPDDDGRYDVTAETVVVVP